MNVLGKSATKNNAEGKDSYGLPEWRIAPAPVAYAVAVAEMEARCVAIAAGTASELVWLLEHPALYTAGRSAKPVDLLQPHFPVYETGRGGEYTYHGPGQRVAYVMLDLTKRGRDVRKYVRNLEAWANTALAKLGVVAERRETDGDRRVGLWVSRNDHDEKIAALGVRVSKWVTSHGIAINVNPDLSHYSGIIPCGITQHGVTSLAALGNDATMKDLDQTLKNSWNEIFG